MIKDKYYQAMLAVADDIEKRRNFSMADAFTCIIQSAIRVSNKRAMDVTYPELSDVLNNGGDCGYLFCPDAHFLCKWEGGNPKEDRWIAAALVRKLAELRTQGLTLKMPRDWLQRARAEWKRMSRMPQLKPFA